MGVITVEAGPTYDWQSGNSYHWGASPSGTTHLDGWNAGTGVPVEYGLPARREYAWV